MLADALATLAAVLVGGLITHRVQSTSWRRDRRAEAYATVIAAITDLDQNLLRNDLERPLDNIDFEDLARIMEPLVHATSLACLYAGEDVDRYLGALITTAYRLDDDGGEERSAWHSQGHLLTRAMRDELHGRRRVRRYWAARRYRG